MIHQAVCVRRNLLRRVIGVSVFSFERYLCCVFSSVWLMSRTSVLHPQPVSKVIMALVARSLIVQEEQRASLSRVCRSVRSSQTLMLPHTLPSHNRRVFSAETQFSVSQDFGSLSNLQVTQPTVGMNFRTPRGV